MSKICSYFSLRTLLLCTKNRIFGVRRKTESTDVCFETFSWLLFEGESEGVYVDEDVGVSGEGQMVNLGCHYGLRWVSGVNVAGEPLSGEHRSWNR
jgi:hypothetical protein